MTFTSLTRWLALRAAIVIGLTCALAAGSATASTESASAPVHFSGASETATGRGVVAHGYAVPGMAVTVTDVATGVSISVPRRAVKRRTKVTITDLGDALYNIHIHGPWRGKVRVTLPKVDGQPVIMHQVDGVWVVENARSVSRTLATARVSSLSIFTNIAYCLSKLRPSGGSALNVVKCLVEKRVIKLPEFIGKKIIGYFNSYDACEPVSSTNWSVDWVEILASRCDNGDVGCEHSTSGCVATPAPPSTPPASGGASSSGGTPSTPAPQPAPSNPAYTGGYVIQDAYYGGTWPRTDPNDGTWHNRSNRPSNAADYWWANGLGVGFSCASYAASYNVSFSDGRREVWNTWLRSTDTWGGRVTGLWVPSAVAQGINTNGIPPGMPTC